MIVFSFHLANANANCFHPRTLLSSIRFLININFPRCVESGVSFLSSKVERIIEAASGHSIVECEGDIVIPCRYS